MSERGGAVVGLLATIGAIVVILIIAGVACFNSAGARPAQRSAPAVHRYRDCDQDYGDCDQRQQHRGNFSPGPFDRSPVDIHDNDVCVSPNCSGRAGGSTTTTTGGGR